MSNQIATLDPSSLSSISGGVKPGDGGCVPQPFPRPRPPLGGPLGGPIVDPAGPLGPKTPILK